VGISVPLLVLQLRVVPVFFLLLQLFTKSLRRDAIDWIPPRVYPLVLFICFVVAVVFPWKHRRGLWKTVGTILLSPFTPVTLRGIVTTNMLSSLSKVTNDITYSICYFVTGQWKDMAMVSCAERWQMKKVVAPLAYTIPVVRCRTVVVNTAPLETVSCGCDCDGVAVDAVGTEPTKVPRHRSSVSLPFQCLQVRVCASSRPVLLCESDAVESW
jgi:hypothetical protein